MIRLNLLLCFVIFIMSEALGQYELMKETSETPIHIGSGNYFYHVDEEKDVKNLIGEIIKLNRFEAEKPLINKNKNLVYAAYMVNPVDEEFVYFMYALRTREGIDVYCLYCAKTYLHFFDYEEGVNRFSLIFDPNLHKNTNLTNHQGIQQN